MFFAVRVISWLHALVADFFAKSYDALVSPGTNALGEVMAVLKSSVHVCVCVLKYVHTITCIVAVAACIHFWNIPHTSLY